MNPMMLGFVLSLLVAIGLAMGAIFQWWRTRHSRAARRFSHRLELALLRSADRRHDNGILKERVLSDSPELTQLLRKMPSVDSLDLILLQSGLDWSVARLVGWMLLLPVVAGAMLMLLRAPWFVLVPLAAASALLPLLYLLRRRAQRLSKMEAQLPEATDLISRALRAGHSFLTALELAGHELPDPIGPEFALAFNEINYGIPLNEALAALARRMPLDDLRYLIVAVLIQRESGGNLAEILDNIGTLIRKRLQLLDKVRVLSAEGKMGGVILTLLPIGVSGLLYVLNPGLISMLWTHPVGIHMLWTAIAMVCIGGLWMRQIVRIHV